MFGAFLLVLCVNKQISYTYIHTCSNISCLPSPLSPLPLSLSLLPSPLSPPPSLSLSPPSQNLDDLYSRPNMAAKTNAQPVVYADLSVFRTQTSGKDHKPHPSPIKDDTRVVYSDLLLKGQPPPPPYEPIELKQKPTSVTVIPPTITMIENKEEQITEFFFSHPGNDDDDGVVTIPAPSRPPPPDGRAPSPPTEDPEDVPPPVPSRSHDNRLPDVVYQYNVTPNNVSTHNRLALVIVANSNVYAWISCMYMCWFVLCTVRVSFHLYIDTHDCNCL